MPLSSTTGKRTVVFGLGEIALRINDSYAMRQFCEYVIGLTLMKRSTRLHCSKPTGRKWRRRSK